MAGRLFKTQCAGTTLQGTRCGCKETYENGFCKYHGGAGESPFDMRKRMALQKARRVMKRFGLPPK